MSSHDGQSCENCLYANHCVYYLFDHALWCMFWVSQNSKNVLEDEAKSTEQ